nr:MAG TPA: hypothetical protein [Ackermannviridae sp.]
MNPSFKKKREDVKMNVEQSIVSSFFLYIILVMLRYLFKSLD